MVSPQTILKALPPLFESRDAKTREKVKATVVSPLYLFLSLYYLGVCTLDAGLVFHRLHCSCSCVHSALQGVKSEGISAVVYP